MTHYAGLDVFINTTFICIVNEKGKVVTEVEAVSTPESIDSFLSGTGLEIEKVGLESEFNPCSQKVSSFYSFSVFFFECKFL